MKKVMILGAGPLQLPTIRKAKENGLYVISLDYDPDAVGFNYADEKLLISTIDKDAVLSAAKKLKPDVVMTSTAEGPVVTVAYVNTKLSKPLDISYEDSLCATNKALMRDRLKANNIPIPHYRKIYSLSECIDCIEEYKLPFIIKPADNAASRGVCLVEDKSVDNITKLYNYCIKYSRSGVVLLEEFMTGAEVSVESFNINRQTQILAITDKMVTPIPYFVELGHAEPSQLSDDIQDEIREITKKTIKAIGVINGPTHTEIKITPEGPKVVEIAARLGGDNITSKLVPLSTGIDLTDCCIRQAVGDDIDLTPKFSRGAAIRYVESDPGVIEHIFIDGAINNIMDIDDVSIYKHVGDKVDILKNSNDRIGHVIAIGKNTQAAIDNCMSALKYIHIATSHDYTGA